MLFKLLGVIRSLATEELPAVDVDTHGTSYLHRIGSCV